MENPINFVEIKQECFEEEIENEGICKQANLQNKGKDVLFTKSENEELWNEHVPDYVDPLALVSVVENNLKPESTNEQESILCGLSTTLSKKVNDQVMQENQDSHNIKSSCVQEKMKNRAVPFELIKLENNSNEENESIFDAMEGSDIEPDKKEIPSLNNAVDLNNEEGMPCGWVDSTEGESDSVAPNPVQNEYDAESTNREESSAAVSEATESTPSTSKESVSDELQYCERCVFGFPSLIQLEEHRKICSFIDHSIFNNIDKCSQNPATQTDSDGIIKKRVRSTERSYQCPHCDYAATQSCNLKVHMRVHSGEKPFKCTLCDFSSSQSSNLKNHIRMHSGVKPFKCPQCEYSASTASNLRLHMGVHMVDKPYKCPQCNYSAALIDTLRNHMKIHSGIKPYKCTQCNYAAAQSSKLKRHLRVHSGDKPYKCTECDYSAGQSFQLKLHVRLHSGEKPHKCPHCNYTAIMSSTLKRHMKIHLGDKQYKCSQCTYSAVNLCHLTRHMKDHLDGEKPYKCTQCNYAAREKGILNVHMRVHSGKKPVKCSECNYSATKLETLQDHMKVHYEENV